MNDNHIFSCFKDRAATKLVDAHLQQLTPATMLESYNNEMLLHTETVVELNERKVFLEGVAAHLGKFDPNDTEGMLQYVRRLYSEKGIELTRTVIEWFRKGHAPNKNYRRNLYDFCVALEMDYQTTAEFFLKAFLTIPYNYKDRVDAVYLYCLKANRPYSVIKKMLEITEEYEATNSGVSNTEHIGLQILSINTDAEFLEYLRANCYDAKHQYSTAKAEFIHLLSQNKIIRTLNSDEINKSAKQRIYKSTSIMTPKRNPDSLGNAELLNQILGYRYQGLTQEQKDNLDNCSLPKFTTDVDISNILSASKSVSGETLRKALILMKFYNYYRSKQILDESDPENVDDIQANYYDFLDETNLMLSKCGFVQLYLRNPYDWIILFCAYSQDPIFYLQDFLEKRYLGQLDG